MTKIWQYIAQTANHTFTIKYPKIMQSTLNPASKCTVLSDVPPVVPEGLKIVSHLSRESKWEPKDLYLIPLPAECSITDEYVVVDEKGNCFSASMLDVLLKSSRLVRLIPEDWKNKSILFMDTVYSKNDMGRYVLSLNYSFERGAGWFYKKRRCSLFVLFKIKELLAERQKIS